MKPAVLVTGSSRGIGRVIARRFALSGYPTAIHYNTHPEEAELFRKQMLLAKANTCLVQGDISREEDVRRMVKEVEQALGPIGILINNAGIALPQQLLTDCTSEDWDRLFSVNVRGTFLCTREVLKGMVSAQSGAIVNVSSMWGITGASCEVPYSAAKAAIIGFTKALAKEVAPSHIRVNCVAPGFIDTEMNAHLSEADREAFRLETPLETIGTPQDVADAVMFLSGEHARFITGQVLSCDGGICI